MAHRSRLLRESSCRPGKCHAVAGDAAASPARKGGPAPARAAARKKNPPDKARKIIAVATSKPDADGWKYLGSVGQRIQGVHPDFDSRSYGCANLGKLVERTGAFDVPKEADGVDVRRKVAAGNDSGAGKGSMT